MTTKAAPETTDEELSPETAGTATTTDAAGESPRASATTGVTGEDATGARTARATPSAMTSAPSTASVAATPVFAAPPTGAARGTRGTDATGGGGGTDATSGGGGTDDAVRALGESCAVPFERARTMPPSVYTSEAFLAAELERVFARDWICVGRSSALAERGDYVAHEIAGEPVLVVRGGDGRLRAMSNVCRHRMSTLLEGTGNLRGAIVCPYHAWSYNLDGSLRGAPAMDANAGFCKERYRLPAIRCEEWLGWIMVSLDPDATPVATALAEVETLVGDYAMEDYVETFRETHVWDTNWKILAENFMESYHLPVCHAGTIGGLSRLDEMICPPGSAAFNYHTILKDETLRIALAHPDNTRLEGERRRMTYLLAIYPSLMITLTPGYFWYLSLHPRGPGRVHILFGGGLSPEFVRSEDAQSVFAELKTLLDEVNREDRGCTERVYRGVLSRHAEPGHLSHLERPNYDFARYLAERVGAFERGAIAER